MTRRAEVEAPPCYVTVLPGLESIAAEEVEQTLRGEVKRTGPGLVVFRVDEVTRDVLRPRTTEDVFLLAWGTDKLTHRAEDLDKIQRWTAKDADWQELLRIHHTIRPKPKGKPSYRLVTQMHGQHAYRRVDAAKALARGLAGKLPASWRPAEENASVEIWLTIHEETAVCGLRLSDKTMRHRTYKTVHLPASLRPTVAAAMVRLAAARYGHLVLDPMCGAGTILAEQLTASEINKKPLRVAGGDIEASAIRTAAANLRRFGNVNLARWDARRLPLADESVDRVISNPPFGKQLSTPEEIVPLYLRTVRQLDRVLKPNGLAVLVVADLQALQDAADKVGWKSLKKLRVRILGQKAGITLWRKE
jgi:tRNA (guanine6-N2)-methyltransferase